MNRVNQIIWVQLSLRLVLLFRLIDGTNFMLFERYEKVLIRRRGLFHFVLRARELPRKRVEKLDQTILRKAFQFVCLSRYR